MESKECIKCGVNKPHNMSRYRLPRKLKKKLKKSGEWEDFISPLTPEEQWLMIWFIQDQIYKQKMIAKLKRQSLLAMRMDQETIEDLPSKREAVKEFVTMTLDSYERKHFPFGLKITEQLKEIQNDRLD